MAAPRRIALFDLDGSLADYELALTRDLRSLQSPAEEDLTDDLWGAEKHGYINHRMRMIKTQPGWWLRLPRIEMGFEVVREAQRIGFEVQVLTKGPGSLPAAWKEKVEWCALQPELAGCPVHIVTDKSQVFGHVLYDDYDPYMRAWLEARPRGLGVMPPRRGNEGFSHHNLFRWDGSNKVGLTRALEAAFVRQPNQPLEL